MSLSIFNRFPPQAEVVVSPEAVKWIGPEDGTLPVCYGFLREGLMERLHQFGPFEVVGDDPEREVRYFRRVLP